MSVDSRLNSIHLDTQRREEFRRARDQVVNAVGEQTRRADGLLGPESGAPHAKTLLHSLAKRIPAGLDYVLMDKDAVYQLKIGLNTVGRMSDNDVVIADPYLSRRHCVVVVHTGTGCELHDVASKNGTYLNGRKISGPTPLVSGDEIRMCDRQLIFVRKADLEGKPPPHDVTIAD